VGGFDPGRLVLLLAMMSVVTTVVDGGGGGGGAGKGEEGSARLDGGHGCVVGTGPGPGTESPTGIEVTAARVPDYVTRRARPRCHGCERCRGRWLQQPPSSNRHRCDLGSPVNGENRISAHVTDERAPPLLHLDGEFIFSSLLLSFSAQITYALRFWPCSQLSDPIDARFVRYLRQCDIKAARKNIV